MSTLTNLKELFDAMRDPFNYSIVEAGLWDNLPTFGGTEPTDTEGIWSWDETHLIIGSCSQDLQLVSRVDYFTE
jgi:hypothetical protein